VAPLVHALVQHCALPALPKHAPFVHVDEEDAYQHPCASWAQVARVVLFSQVRPAALQAGSLTHPQAAGEAPPPPVQAWWAPHGIGGPHAPVASHVCTPPLGEQVVEPGLHTPWQAPETHALFMHGMGVPQWPLASHPWTELPEHCVEFGEQEPAHAPIEHN
jgi:hypothetical protein